LMGPSQRICERLPLLTMQPQNNRRSHRHTTAKSSVYKEPRNPNLSRPSRAWRKEYKCKPNKGDHTMVRVLPDHVYPQYKGLTVDEYYAKKIEEDRTKRDKHPEKYLWSTIEYWRCSACGHKELKFLK
jgi:hypothetical protein